MALPKSILLIISGSVAAYKSLELIRLLRARGVTVNTILTQGGAQFITPLAISSLTGTPTYGDLFSLTDETAMGHIQLSRSADVVLVAPASANLLAHAAAGMADDLATTALLATDKPVIVAPAMNHRMWEHATTQANIATLRARGVAIIEPVAGDMACGEYGVGRMAEPAAMLAYLEQFTPATSIAALPKTSTVVSAAPSPSESLKPGALAGRRAIVTSGSTQEPIDPVRFIGNHSSGKQGHAIAAALASAGADVTLICGHATAPTPENVRVVHAATAEAMLAAIETALPADIFVGAAAIADWRVTHVAKQKIKKHGKIPKMTLDFIATPDVLATIGSHAQRPDLVIGFAAETERLQEYARTKRLAKRCDWMVGNLVSAGVFGAEENEVLLLTNEGEEQWPRLNKREVARRLTQKIVDHFAAPAAKTSRRTRLS